MAHETRTPTAGASLSTNEAYIADEPLGSGEEITRYMRTPSPTRLTGIVTRADTAFDLVVRWLDHNDNVRGSEPIGEGIPGGDTQVIEVPARSEAATVAVIDAANGTGIVNATLHIQ